MTGKVRVLDLKEKIPESSEQPVYLMQVMKLGEVKCLVMFDTGANTNVINGNLVEMLDFQVIDRVPTTIKGVGDSKVNAEFGTYKLNLGPTPDGKFHEIIAHGTSRVTSQLPKIDLTEVNKEVKELGIVPESTKLPKKVGGAPVRLLIGIRNIPAFPKLLHRTEQG